MTDAILVSADGGNGFFKVRSGAVPGLSFPSVLSVMNETTEGFSLSLNGGADDQIICFDGKLYAIGETVRFKGLTPVTITHRSRIATEFYRVLFAAALAATVRRSATCNVVLSLPPAAYWDKDTMKAILSGRYEVEVMTDGKMRRRVFEVPIEGMRVIPEGVGTVCCLALNERGAERDSSLASRQVGLVDIGTYTTDFVLLNGLRIVRSGTDSLPHGLHDIHEKLRTFASRKGVDLDYYGMDEILRQGYFLKGRDRIHFKQEAEAWASELTQAISAMIRSKWNGGDNAEDIIVAGGGEPQCNMLLAQEFSQVRSIAETGIAPWLTNCEGAYRYGLLKSGRG